MEGNIIGAIIFWTIGIFVALLGNKNIREYKDYEHPKFYLVLSIWVCITMSWALVFISLINDTYKLPSWLYHDCYNNSDISYEEEYLDEEGNKTSPKDCKVHNCYRVFTCRKCGKVKKELL